MDIFYKKNKNKELFSNLESETFGNFRKCQNFIPLYARYFSLNDTNWNAVNLNNSKYIRNVAEMKDDNNYVVQLNNNRLVDCYIKLAPLIDPSKYMIGKYKDFSYNSIKINDLLPSFDTKTHPKLDNVNNMAYTDGFFSYLSSQLRQETNNPHCIDFYGSYLGIKNNYKLNIYDDLEYLYESDYFIENIDKLFKINGEIDNEFINFNTRKNKKKLVFDKTLSNLSVKSLTNTNVKMNDVFTTHISNETTENCFILNLADIHSLEEFSFENETPTSDESVDTQADKPNNLDGEGKSECSSRTSKTSNESCEDDNEGGIILHSNESCASSHIDDSDDDDDETDSSSDSDDDDDDDDEYLEAEIDTFPVQLIAIEKMYMTLDDYMTNYAISKDEWLSIFMQIFMTLLTYKKAFGFTHNDLHTNNIMFNETNKEFLYYRFNRQFYKVPTYGKIYKIIDFGRAIYKYKGELICSDSYHPTGDAATQFNFGPYYNPKKPTVEPNYAFDLCRLGCSLYDQFVDNDIMDPDFDKETKQFLKKIKSGLKEIEKLVVEWCKDDEGRNVLYKSNGKERYPGFKLYKMITRTVHKHTPERQLKKPMFHQFTTKMRNINTRELINIDAIQDYTK